jgi:hypothetical protein
MDPRDFRGIGREAQEALHEPAVYLLLHEGTTQGKAAQGKRD